VIVQLDHIGKRYRRQWVFRDVCAEMRSGQCWAITGPNGSGKSTLTQLIAGFLTPSEGNVRWEFQGRMLEPGRVHQLLSWSAPAVDLYEDFTLKESIRFHSHFRNWRGMEEVSIPELIGLESVADKPLSAFSSGMKQRVKLGMAILSDTPILILDEPTSYLDSKAIAWYRETLAQHSADRLICVATNRLETEAPTGAHILDMNERTVGDGE